MITRVQKWGNSLGVRIPKTIASHAHVDEGTAVDVSIEDDRLVITPVRKTAYRLKELLDRVTPDNVHGEIEFGGPVGREVW